MQVQALNTMPTYGIYRNTKVSKPTFTGIKEPLKCDSVSFSGKGINNTKRIIIMLGAPNSGKGTSARMISAKYSIPQISTGDILRNEIKKGSELGKKAQSYMNSGGLVPDDLIMDIFKSRIAKPDCSNGFILDGFPRTVQQAEKLEELLKKEKNIDVKVINLNVDENILYDRSAKRFMCKDCSRTYSLEKYNPQSSKCECGGELIKRADDTPEVLANRIANYKKQSLSLLEYYSDRVVNFDIHSNNEQAVKIMEKIFDVIGNSIH